MADDDEHQKQFLRFFLFSKDKIKLDKLQCNNTIRTHCVQFYLDWKGMPCGQFNSISANLRKQPCTNGPNVVL